MESKYSNRDFEQYVKENADQYRMFPSDKVWKGINTSLHTRRKWYGFWLGFLLLLTGGAVTWVMTTYPSSKKENSATENVSIIPSPITETVSAEKTTEEIKRLLTFTKDKGPSAAINTTLVTELENSSATELPVVTQDHLIKETIDFSPAPSSRHNDVETTHADLTGSIYPNTNAIVELKDLSTEKKLDNNLPTNTVDNTVINNKQTEALPLLTIESVTNAYEFKQPKKRVSWQLFVTPTVSYRKLSVNKSLDNPSAFNYPFDSLSDINKAVTHKPDLGLQIGVLGRYPITNAFKIRGGFQFNINRYDIKAYAFNGEVATIDLNGGNGNTISTWTNYRNFAGYKSDWLKNYYFSISAPIGAEIKLIGNKKTNFGIASTIQPTYILKDRAYLISTDYKNYAEVPRLVRHVNLNTSFETFVNYTSGKTKWQIGPQVRYQILSSFHNKYPVKENLFDFGVKVGVTLNE